MLVERGMIDDQLAKIAAAIASAGRPCDADTTRYLVSQIFACWRQAHEVGVRRRAWRAMRNRFALTEAVTSWSTWLNKNRGLGAERAAREAHAEAIRSVCHELLSPKELVGREVQSSQLNFCCTFRGA